MPERTRVTLRRLSGGAACEATAVEWRNDLLDIDCGGETAAAEFIAGDLVEMQSETRLLLGVVRECRAAALTIAVEHSLDRAEASSIKEAWD